MRLTRTQGNKMANYSERRPVEFTSPRRGVQEMTGVVPCNDVSSARMDGGGPRKRKRLAPIVDSPVILSQASQYHLAEYDSQGKCIKKVCTTVQESSAPDRDVLGVRQQVIVKTHTGSVQPAQTAHSAFWDTTTDLSKASCKNGCSGHITAEQVCFGMVCNLNTCRLLPLRWSLCSMPALLDASSLV